MFLASHIKNPEYPYNINWYQILFQSTQYAHEEKTQWQKHCWGLGCRYIVRGMQTWVTQFGGHENAHAESAPERQAVHLRWVRVPKPAQEGPARYILRFRMCLSYPSSPLSDWLIDWEGGAHFRLRATNSSAGPDVSIEKSQGFQTVRCLIGCLSERNAMTERDHILYTR